MNAKVKYVYVLDMDGNPLMPTKRFGKVRRMLRDGLAKVVRRDIFTIQLLYEPKTHVVDELTLGCDTDILTLVYLLHLHAKNTLRKKLS